MDEADVGFALGVLGVAGEQTLLRRGDAEVVPEPARQRAVQREGPASASLEAVQVAPLGDVARVSVAGLPDVPW